MAKIPTTTDSKVADKTTAPKRIAAPKSVPAPAPQKKPAAKRLKSTPEPAKTAAPRRKPAAKPAAPSISQANIALRAYSLAENRLVKGLHGNEQQDWLEAERQLQSESQPKLKNGKQ